MRIVSFVPSWTETLIQCGANVVGRTRFCIHPKEKVQSIQVVGGTKDINIAKLNDLDPDWCVLDREENTLEMYEQISCPKLATHIQSIKDVPIELRRISQLFTKKELSVSKSLEKLAREADDLYSTERNLNLESWDQLPGLLEWIRFPDLNLHESKIVYVIWHKPWMAVANNTFCGSLLEQILGIPLWTPSSQSLFDLKSLKPAKSSASKYPTFEIDEVPKDAVLLFSSEPFPFHSKKEMLKSLDRSAAIVDGELWSWYGYRSLQLLKNNLLASQI